MKFAVGGSGVVWVTLGAEDAEHFEFALHSESLREFLRLGAEALQEMDAVFAREEAGQALAMCAPS